MSLSMQDGNFRGHFIVALTLTPTAVGAATTAEQTFTVPGVQLTDVVESVSPPSLTAGTFIASSRVPAVGQVAVGFGNTTAGSLTPAAGSYKFTVTRVDGPYLAQAN